MLRSVAAALATAFLVAAAGAQPAAVDDARRDIQRTYDFEPSTMTFSEQAQRAPELSKLWDRYDKTPETYRAALRAALAADGQRELLYCDGGMLLMAKSKEAADRELGLRSIAKCSFAEIEHTPYFYMMHQLAREGVDTLELQWPMLRKPQYSVFVVQHAMNLGQNYAFMYPLMMQDESRYVPRLVERLKTEADSTAQKTLLTAIFYSATPQAEAALRAIAESDSSFPVEARAEAAKAVGFIDRVRTEPLPDRVKLAMAAPGIDPDAPQAELRTKRKARMRSVSDEALMELGVYTRLLYRTFK